MLELDCCFCSCFCLGSSPLTFGCLNIDAGIWFSLFTCVEVAFLVVLIFLLDMASTSMLTSMVEPGTSAGTFPFVVSPTTAVAATAVSLTSLRL